MTMKKILILLAGVGLGALLYQWLVHNKDAQSWDDATDALP
jgi:hypothetical protein